MIFAARRRYSSRLRSAIALLPPPDRGLIAPLARYNIPEPISGGLLIALLLAIVEQAGGVTFSFDSTLKPVLMLSFFAAVGLSADLSQLGKGGKRMVMFVLVLIPFLILQNGLGLLLALRATLAGAALPLVGACLAAGLGLAAFLLVAASVLGSVAGPVFDVISAPFRTSRTRSLSVTVTMI